MHQGKRKQWKASRETYNNKKKIENGTPFSRPCASLRVCCATIYSNYIATTVDPIVITIIIPAAHPIRRDPDAIRG